MRRIVMCVIAALLCACTRGEAPVITPLYPFEPASGASPARYLCGRPAVMGVRVERGSLQKQRWEVTWKVAGPGGEVKDILAGANTCLSHWDTTTDEPTFCYVMDLKQLFPDCSAGLEGNLRPTVCLTSFDTKGESTCYETEVRFTREPGVEESGCVEEFESLLKRAIPGTSPPSNTPAGRLESKQGTPSIDELVHTAEQAIGCLEQKGLLEEAYLQQRELVHQLQLREAPGTVRLPVARLLGLQLAALRLELPLERMESAIFVANVFISQGDYTQADAVLKGVSTSLNGPLGDEAAARLFDRRATIASSLALLTSQAQFSRQCMSHNARLNRPDKGYSCRRILAEALQHLGVLDRAAELAASAFQKGANSPRFEESEVVLAVSNLAWWLLQSEDLPTQRWVQLIEHLNLATVEPGRYPNLTAFLRRYEGSTTPIPSTLREELAQVLMLDAEGLWRGRNSLSQLSNEYVNLAWLGVQRKSPTTIRQYLKEIRPFLENYDSMNDRDELLQIRTELALLERDRLALQVLEPRLRRIVADPAAPTSLEPERWARLGRVYTLLGDHVRAQETLRRAVNLLQKGSRLLLPWHVTGYLRAARHISDPLLIEAMSLTDGEFLSSFHQATAAVQMPHLKLGLHGQVAELDRFGSCKARLESHLATYSSLSIADREQWRTTRDKLGWECESELEKLVGGDVNPAPDLDIDSLRQHIPNRTEVWVLSSLPDQLVGVRLGRTGSRRWTVTVDRHTLLDAIAEMQAAIKVGIARGQPPSFSRRVDELLASLVPEEPPGGGALIVVLDPVLRDLPVEFLPYGTGPLWTLVSSLSYSEDLATLGRDLQRPPTRWWKRALAVADAETELASLPGAARNAALIKMLDANATVLLGTQATRAAVLADSGGLSPIVFSVHGSAEDGDPLSASLRLTGGEPLTVVDLMRLGADGLVVLGACEGGAGGVAGATLVQAARASGAQAVLSSRFEVDDTCIASFEEAFYPDIKGGYSPGAALHRALQRLTDTSCQSLLVASLWVVGDVQGSDGPRQRMTAP